MKRTEQWERADSIVVDNVEDFRRLQTKWDRALLAELEVLDGFAREKRRERRRERGPILRAPWRRNRHQR